MFELMVFDALSKEVQKIRNDEGFFRFIERLYPNIGSQIYPFLSANGLVTHFEPVKMGDCWRLISGAMLLFFASGENNFVRQYSYYSQSLVNNLSRKRNDRRYPLAHPQVVTGTMSVLVENVLDNFASVRVVFSEKDRCVLNSVKGLNEIELPFNRNEAEVLVPFCGDVLSLFSIDGYK